MTALLEIEDLTVRFRVGSPLIARLRGHPAPVLTAVDGLTLSVERGTALGIVGESGCGKSTLARTVVGLEAADAGRMRLDGIELGPSRSIDLRRRIQMVFQDPSSALNPKFTVERTLRELVRMQNGVDASRCRARCEELMALVDLPIETLDRRPAGLSGGQRQRVSIARALALEPELLIADESVAALDVSVQASILNLFGDLRRELGLTIILISHDLSVVRQTCQDVAVMYLGTIVEHRRTDELIDDPWHPYTQALIAAAPRFGSRREPGSFALGGEPPSPMATRSGCAFAPRCPQAIERCSRDVPALLGDDRHGRVACHVAENPMLLKERDSQ